MDVVALAERQQRSEDAALGVRNTRQAERVAECVWDCERTRRLNFARNLRKHGDRRRSDAVPLNLRLDQADRLMTERSNRDKERDIDFVLYEETRCGGSRAFHQTAWCGDRAHERQVVRSHAANLASTRQLAEPLEWKG